MYKSGIGPLHTGFIPLGTIRLNPHLHARQNPKYCYAPEKKPRVCISNTPSIMIQVFVVLVFMIGGGQCQRIVTETVAKRCGKSDDKQLG